jgi:adenylosuccinate lyase
MARDEAYRIVQAAAQRALSERIDMRAVVAAEPAIQALDGAGDDGFDLDQIFDYNHYTRYAAEIVARLDALH